MILDEADRLF